MKTDWKDNTKGSAAMRIQHTATIRRSDKTLRNAHVKLLLVALFCLSAFGVFGFSATCFAQDLSLIHI